MILKGAAIFLLLLMQDVSVASVNRMLKQRRRRRRRRTAKKQQVQIRKTTFLHVQHALLQISLQSLHDYDVKLPDFTRISSFVEDLNTGQRLPFSFFKLGYMSPLEFKSRKICQHLTFEAARINFSSEFFCSRRRRCCLSYLIQPFANSQHFLPKQVVPFTLLEDWTLSLSSYLIKMFVSRKMVEM